MLNFLWLLWNTFYCNKWHEVLSKNKICDYKMYSSVIFSLFHHLIAWFSINMLKKEQNGLVELNLLLWTKSEQLKRSIQFFFLTFFLNPTFPRLEWLYLFVCNVKVPHITLIRNVLFYYTSCNSISYCHTR